MGEYVPPATQEELDAIVGARLKREREKYADYDDLKAAAAKAAESEGARKRELEEARAEVFNDDETVPGSSPRVRGAPRHQLPPGRVRRIIPAGAGSTRPWPTGPRRRWDHPRGCGEHYGACMMAATSLGSSPRVRGALLGLLPPRYARGIIPAGAGSTTASWARRRSRRDHPRGCGEHCLYEFSDCLDDGSSPRVRGAH